MDKGAWLTIVYRLAKSLTLLNTHTHTHMCCLYNFSVNLKLIPNEKFGKLWLMN